MHAQLGQRIEGVCTTMELLALSHHWLTYETTQANPAAYQLREISGFGVKGRLGLRVLSASCAALAMVLGLMATVAKAITAYVDRPGQEVSIRDRPVDGGIVRIVFDGDRLDVTETTQDGWTQLTDGNWIPTDSIRFSNTDGSDQGGNATPPPTDSWGTPATVAVNQLDARWGPGDQYGLHRTLFSGNQVLLTGTISPTGWMQLIDGTWVLGNQLNPRYGGFDYQGQPPTDDWGSPATVTATRANVRWGPGEDYGLNRVLGSGATVQLTGNIRSNGWVELIDGTWVAGNLINPLYGGYTLPTTPSPSTTAATVDTPAYTQNNDYNLNVRAGPGVGNRILRVIADGQPIALTGNQQNGWYELADGSWVAGKYQGRQTLRFEAISRLISNPQTSPGVLRRGVQDPAVRQLQTRLQTLGYLPQNAVITDYYGSLTEQAVINFQRTNGLTVDGVAGTTTLNLLYQTPPVSGVGNTVPTVPGQGSRVQITTANDTAIPVRENPNVNARQLDTLTNGQTVTATGRMDNGWIQLESGGWVEPNTWQVLN